MAILTQDEIFFTQFEPKVQNRFIMYMDGIPTFMIKGLSGLGFEQNEIILNHINTYRKVKGKLRWNDVTMTLFDPITPSGAQAVMEWTRLHHESVTGRDGYSDFYKKELVLDLVGPVGDVISEWVIKGAFIKNATFGDLDYDNDSAAQTISLTLGMDYCVLNF
tara:strand:- start:523 stop:1011 length:489 start_codon:yes stop_codon:yes gene_type:complete